VVVYKDAWIACVYQGRYSEVFSTAWCSWAKGLGYSNDGGGGVALLLVWGWLWFARQTAGCVFVEKLLRGVCEESEVYWSTPYRGLGWW
jgi:hypothetical protein